MMSLSCAKNGLLVPVKQTLSDVMSANERVTLLMKHYYSMGVYIHYMTIISSICGLPRKLYIGLTITSLLLLPSVDRMIFF